jgi:hypothetical protein
MEIQKMLITPTMAKKLLEKNISNRRLKQKTVEKYTKDMQLGIWKEDTGELIKISISGYLLDGQHRLYAIVKSNISQKMHVGTDLPDEVFKVIDTGSSRNSADIFHIDGIANSNTIPSIIYTYKRFIGGYTGGNSERESSAIVLNSYYERPDFYQNVAKKTLSWYKAFSRILTPAIIGGFYCYFQSINEALAEDFFNQLCYGNGNICKPIALLRKKLVEDRLSTKKLSIATKNAFIIKAWNYYRKNEVVKILKFDFDNEKFPKAI